LNPVTHAEIPKAAEPTRPSQAETTSSAKDLLEDAKRLHRAGRMDMARPLYLEVLEKDPGYVDALNNLGVLWIHEKNYPEAKKSFYKAILLDARYVDPHYNLACVYALEDDTDQSMAHLKKAIALDPSVIQWAAEDADLENLRQLPQFRELLDETKTSTSGP
jgi:tetratricopeptide (TPR) repeat protein